MVLMLDQLNKTPKDSKIKDNESGRVFRNASMKASFSQRKDAISPVFIQRIHHSVIFL